MAQPSVPFYVSAGMPLASMALALLYHPVGDVARGGIEVDAYLCDGQSAEGEALVVVLEVYLLHGSLGTLVEFQFHDVDLATVVSPFCAYSPSR